MTRPLGARTRVALIAATTAGRIPRPNPARLSDPPRAELVERGRYLVAVASCALCHGSDGASGAKLSWRPMGTVWARNLTPDRETGLGAWRKHAQERDHRPHVLFVPVRRVVPDHRLPAERPSALGDAAANRARDLGVGPLPPVRRAIPATRPPAADDCAVYSFWVDASSAPGCR